MAFSKYNIEAVDQKKLFRFIQARCLERDDVAGCEILLIGSLDLLLDLAAIESEHPDYDPAWLPLKEKL
jgi:hypothetical protein